MKFRSDSEFLKVLEERSDDLTFLNELPNRAAMNGAVQGCPQLLVELSRLWLDTLPKTPEQQAQQDSLLKQVKDFHLGDFKQLIQMMAMMTQMQQMQ